MSLVFNQPELLCICEGSPRALINCCKRALSLASHMLCHAPGVDLTQLNSLLSHLTRLLIQVISTLPDARRYKQLGVNIWGERIIISRDDKDFFTVRTIDFGHSVTNDHDSVSCVYSLVLPKEKPLSVLT